MEIQIAASTLVSASEIYKEYKYADIHRIINKGSLSAT